MPSLSILCYCFSSIINILFLPQHNTGNQSPVAIAMKPPMQVCVLAQHFHRMHCVVHWLYLLLTSQSREASAGDAALLHCPCIRSGFDSCLVEMLSPATLGFLSALCSIMTKFKKEKNIYTQSCQLCFVSFYLKMLFV